MLTQTTLVNVSLGELTEAWNRCWQGYRYEMSFSEDNMKAWLSHGHVDLSHSLALIHAGKIIGFSLLAVQGNEGWIAGTCIDPLYRGKHLFGSLMGAQIHKTQDLTLQRIFLEVLIGNHAAKVYQAVGFKSHRELLSYRIPSKTLDSLSFRQVVRPFREVTVNDYFQARRSINFTPVWQRRQFYLHNYFPLRAWLDSTDNSGALFTGEKGSVLVDAWSRSLDKSEYLLAMIQRKSGGTLTLTNQPRDWFAAYLTQRGILPSFIQQEMIYSR